MINDFVGNGKGYVEFDGFIFFKTEEGIFTLDISRYTAIVTVNELYTVGIFSGAERIEPLHTVDTKEQAFASAINKLLRKVMSDERI